MNNKLKLAFVIIILTQLSVWAAPQPPQPTPPPGEAIIPGIVVALIAGVGYGIYRLRHKN